MIMEETVKRLQRFVGSLHLPDRSSSGGHPRPFLVLDIEHWANDLFRVQLLCPSGTIEFVRVEESWLIGFCA